MRGEGLRRRLLPVSALAFALLPAAAARAGVDSYGHVTGRDRATLRHLFLAHHHGGFRIVGYHASQRYHLRYAGVYWIQASGGENVASGAALFGRHGRSWRALAHPSRGLMLNLGQPARTYVITFSGAGEYKSTDTMTTPPDDASDPQQQTEVYSRVTDAQLKIAGTAGSPKPYETSVESEPQDAEAPQTLLSSTGTYTASDNTDPFDAASCSFTAATDSQPQFDLLRRPKPSLTIDFGDQAEVNTDGNPSCRPAYPKDPAATNDEITVTVPAPAGLLIAGRPFTVPFGIHHTGHHGEPADGDTEVVDESLALDGTARFALAGIEVPNAG